MVPGWQDEEYLNYWNKKKSSDINTQRLWIHFDTTKSLIV